MRRWGLVVVLAVLVAGACSSDDDDDAGPTTSVGESTTTSTSGATTSTTAFVGSTTPTSIAADVDHVALLTAVRVAGHPGFDRVVFEFRSDTDRPGVDAGYVDQLKEDGSGEDVDVEGTAFLQVRMEPASGVNLSTEPFEETYTGPRRLRGDTAVVTEVARTGDFEANLTWGIGLRSKASFRVTVLTNPARVVVDVAT